MEFIKVEELLENNEFQDLINRLPIPERSCYNKLREKRDIRLLTLLQYDDIQLQRYSLIHLLVDLIIQETFNQWKYIFRDYDTDAVKRITSIENNQSTSSTSSTSASLTYGEIDFFSFANILERVQPRQGEIFVDLGLLFLYLSLYICYLIIIATGHGTGKGLICASLLYGSTLQRCYGIEIVHSLYAISTQIIDEFLASRSNNNNNSNNQFESSLVGNNCEIIVEEGNLLINDYWTQAGTSIIIIIIHTIIIFIFICI